MEGCLVATSIAILLCHPNSTIKCFNPKPKPPPSSRKNKTKPMPPTPTITSASKSPESQPTTPENKRHSRRKSEAKYTRKESLPQSKTRHEDSNVILKRTFNESFSFGVAESILRIQGWDPQARMVVEGVLKVKHKDPVIKRLEKYREVVKESSLKIEDTRVVKERYRLMETRFYASVAHLFCVISDWMVKMAFAMGDHVGFID